MIYVKYLCSISVLCHTARGIIGSRKLEGYGVTSSLYCHNNATQFVLAGYPVTRTKPHFGSDFWLPYFYTTSAVDITVINTSHYVTQTPVPVEYYIKCRGKLQSVHNTVVLLMSFVQENVQLADACSERDRVGSLMCLLMEFCTLLFNDYCSLVIAAMNYDHTLIVRSHLALIPSG